jgi:rhodanese-related sulfurtransferase
VTRIALALSLVLSLAACSEGAASASTSGSGGSARRARSSRVSSTEAHALVAAGATLLDVRSPGEFASGHIDGALLVPVDELDARLSEVPQDRPVVVYCRSGSRSAHAASILGAAGYEVHDLGGMSNWDE